MGYTEEEAKEMIAEVRMGYTEEEAKEMAAEVQKRAKLAGLDVKEEGSSAPGYIFLTFYRKGRVASEPMLPTEAASFLDGFALACDLFS